MIEVLIFLGLFFVAAVGFILLDQWHMRRAWRRADAEARKYLRSQKRMQ